MTCRDFVEHLSDLLSGELGEALRQQAQAHLLECPDCRNYRLSYEITVRLTRAAFDDDRDGPTTRS
jgi:anti-sigma factor RsiW